MTYKIHVLVSSKFDVASKYCKLTFEKCFVAQTQFVIIFTHITVSMFRGCDTPMWGHLLLFFYMMSLMALFGNFYIKQYLQKRRGGGRAAAAAVDDDDTPKVRAKRPVDSGDESSKKLI